MYLGFLLQMLTDPCGILLIQPLVLVVLLWVFIILLLEFNNNIAICWFTGITNNNASTSFIFPYSFKNYRSITIGTAAGTTTDGKSVNVYNATLTNAIFFCRYSGSYYKESFYAIVCGY